MSVISLERPDATAKAPDTSKARTIFSEWWSHPLASYYLVLASTVLLSAFGVIAIASASSVWSHFEDGNSWDYTIDHLKVMVLAAVIVAALAWDKDKLSLRSGRLAFDNEKFLIIISWAGFFVAVLLLMLVLIPGVGYEYYGNHSWLQIGSFRLQPSEPAKAALVLWSAA
ncbi:MAG: FtsW/RodA/SpoVE family cell cycle protein, partial [Propionibacteriaceae bacterium]|nr:FtsW/RodA/SpoVE family cell cycle protein [Propionibacteriaceae bacterium]